MSVTSDSIAITIEDILSTLKSLETPDLFKLLKAATAETEKKSKTITKATKASANTKKSGSMPKGAVPPQLKKPRAWVEFTLKNALENGWESFTITQKKGGEIEEITMPASTLHEGAYVYEDSVTDKTPNGKQIIHKEAMSLSKFRKESGHPTYAEFEAQYAEEIASDSASETASEVASTSSSKKSVVKKTAAEKAAEMEAKKAEKEAEKEAKKAEKEAEKERKKAEKEAEKEAAKAAKEAEKEAKKAEKKPVTKAVIPAKAVKPVETKAVVVKKAEEKPAEAPVKTTKPAAKPAAPKKEEVIPDDGMVHPWTFEGKKYLRNADGETWSVGSDGGIGKWVGVYSSETKKIDTTVAEPEFDDEE
jgi:hypothetical protein